MNQYSRQLIFIGLMVQIQRCMIRICGPKRMLGMKVGSCYDKESNTVCVYFQTGIHIRERYVKNELSDCNRRACRSR